MADIEETIEEQEEEKTDDIEVQARDMGWVPEEDFKGDPAKWTPASDWVHRGENYIPIMRKRLSDQQGEISRLKTEQTQVQGRFVRLEKMQSAALIQQRDHLVAQFGERKRAAVESGDTDAYDQAEQAELAALTGLAKQAEVEPDKPSGLPAHVQAEVEGWLGENLWFNSNVEMQGVASQHHEQLLKEKPGLTIGENLKEVRAYVARRYPEAFATSEEKRGSPVEGGSRSVGGGGRTTGRYSKLPKEAKDQCDSQIKEGLFARDDDGKLIEETAKKRERYAKLYFGDDDE